VLYRGTEEYDHIYWSAPEVPAPRRRRPRGRQEPPDLGRLRLRALSAARGRREAGGEWNSSPHRGQGRTSSTG
jgi:hypothetical protein